MTITAKFVIRSPDLPLTGVAESLPSGQFECEHGLCLKPDCDVFVVHFDPADDVSEADLAALEEVVETTPLGRSDDRDVYRCTVELGDVVARAFAPERFTAVEVEPVVVAPDGWYETKLFEDREVLTGIRDRFEEYGITLEILSITQGEHTSDEDPQHGLTDRQYEALTLAISRGYYETPRRATTEELADEMGISQPSMSTLLRRGEQQLLSSTLEPQRQLQTLTS